MSFEDLSELENVFQDIHSMCNVVINCVDVGYIKEEGQEKFTDILMEQIADMLYKYISGL